MHQQGPTRILTQVRNNSSIVQRIFICCTRKFNSLRLVWPATNALLRLHENASERAHGGSPIPLRPHSKLSWWHHLSDAVCLDKLGMTWPSQHLVHIFAEFGTNKRSLLSQRTRLNVALEATVTHRCVHRRKNKTGLLLINPTSYSQEIHDKYRLNILRVKPQSSLPFSCYQYCLTSLERRENATARTLHHKL